VVARTMLPYGHEDRMSTYDIVDDLGSDDHPDGRHFSRAIRSIFAQARQEAASLGHEYVGTEHLLLSLLASVGSIAAAMIDQLRIDRQTMRAQVMDVVKRGKGSGNSEDVPYTSRAKLVLDLAVAEAAKQREVVGTGHLLVGMVREDKGIAAEMLHDAGVTLNSVRELLVNLLHTRLPNAGNSHSAISGAEVSQNPAVPGLDTRLLLCIGFPPDSDVSEMSDAVIKFYAALNRLHILSGGSGLVIDSWGVAERELSIAEV